MRLLAGLLWVLPVVAAMGLSGGAAALANQGAGPNAAKPLASSSMAPNSSPAIPSTSETIPDPSAWQAVIDGQIEAFRKGDAPAALGYAGATFKRNFTDPSIFMLSVAAAGYGPIFTSISHSFGKFTRQDADTVVQVVDFIGAKQELYQAIYAVTKESDGWRVQGVQLMQEEGMGV